MSRLLRSLALSLPAVLTMSAQPPTQPEDPHLWLEEVTGEKALDWVKARNGETMKELGTDPRFDRMKGEILKVLDSNARIPFVGKIGDHFYNFWRDAKHPRGLWRRTSLAEYRKAEPAWDVILDLDAIGTAEKENWVWGGAQVLKAGGYRHVLVTLSRGGADATVTREFDLKTRQFVKGGFELPEAKGSLGWIDKDSVYVSTDFGPGSMTDSGYARIVKLWKRGTPLSAATTIYEGKASDISVGAGHDDTKGFERDFISRGITMTTSETFLRKADGKLVKLDVPEDANANPYREWMTVQLRTPWTVGGKTYTAGSLLVTRFDDFMAGKRDFTVLFEPTATRSLEGISWTKSHLLVTVLEDVKSVVSIATPGKNGWKQQPFPGAPAFSSVGVGGIDPEHSDEVFFTVSGFTTPTSLQYGKVGGTFETLKSTPAFFDASKVEVSQHFATSKDGTRVPYFQIAPKGLKLDGQNPTLLYGYGGFEVSLTPGYNPVSGLAWTTQGGVYILANIRGGGEYGPTWHQAALKQNRLRCYEDFAGVAEDLFKRKITTPQHLGAQGGSNGGLLMGNMTTLYPQLFKAIVCQVPLLDMKRYSQLLAGASWMGEYGDPSKPEEWSFIQKFSPYHNLKSGVTYPSVFFTTSTRDDRVHPGHARKMMARMKEMGADVRYFENIEGGHGGAADNKQKAHMSALEYTFLWQKLK